MLSSDTPTRFNIPFANNAGGAFTRPVPQAQQPGGAASDFDGFPPVTFDDLNAGGIPPDGRDMNGILNQISAWSRWYSAGGPIGWDSAFSAAVGGYPAGAIVQSGISAGTFFFNTTEANTTNPETGGAGWLAFKPIPQARIVTASGAFAVSTADQSVGLNRTVSVATSSTTLPAATPGFELWIEDLVGNFNAFPVRVTASAGTTIAGLPYFDCNVNRQCARFKFYGSNLWSLKS